MATWTEEAVTPTLIPNTTMVKRFLDGVFKIYRISPNDGYVLHNKIADEEVIDPDTLEPTGETIPRFCTGMCSVRFDYDFNTVTSGTYTYTDENGDEQSVNVTKIGANEFYTLPENLVPISQTYGGGNNNHEVASAGEEPAQTE